MVLCNTNEYVEGETEYCRAVSVNRVTFENEYSLGDCAQSPCAFIEFTFAHNSKS